MADSTCKFVKINIFGVINLDNRMVNDICARVPRLLCARVPLITYARVPRIFCARGLRITSASLAKLDNTSHRFTTFCLAFSIVFARPRANGTTKCIIKLLNCIKQKTCESSCVDCSQHQRRRWLWKNDYCMHSKVNVTRIWWVLRFPIKSSSTSVKASSMSEHQSTTRTIEFFDSLLNTLIADSTFTTWSGGLNIWSAQTTAKHTNASMVEALATAPSDPSAQPKLLFNVT